MNTLHHFTRNALLGVFAAFSAASANGAVSTPLNIEFSGGVAPASAATPWVNGTFANEVGGTVLFSLEALHLTNPEKMTGFYFNFNDALNVQNLSFQLVSSGAFALPTIDRSRDAYKADGDGKYDIRLNFATAGNASQTFGQGDTLVYRLSYTSAINASQFGYLSLPAGGHGPFYAAAHIQDTPGGQSGWIAATEFMPVPEASPLLAGGSLLTLVVAGVVSRGRRRLSVPN